MQTGEVAKALGVHYNTAYTLAASRKVQVPKGDNGQYDWSQAHLTEAKKIMAERGSRRPRRAAKATPTRAGNVQITDKQTGKVLGLLARLEGKSEQDYLRDLIQREAGKVRSEVVSVLG